MSIAAIKAAVNLIDIAREYGELRKAGPQWVAVCMWHDDHKPSCYLWDDHYHCHVCSAHGDVIDYVAKGEGISKGASMHLLSDRTGIPLDNKPVSRVARQYGREESAFALWWQKQTVRKLERQLTAYCRYATEEDCERIGARLRAVRAARGVELKALAARAGDREEWREDVRDGENFAWLCVEAICLAN